MLVITYDNIEYLCGGFGDRMVGLISLKLIARKLNKEFRILWVKENVKPYLNYEKYEFNEVGGRQFKRIQLVDRQKDLKEYLMKSEIQDLFSEDHIITLNQEIAQYLYKNPNLKIEKDYYNDILYEYSTLYTDILIPRFTVNLPTNLIGIQIRCGDKYMEVGDYVYIENPEVFIKDRLEFINSFYQNDQIFLTSDFNDIYNIAYPIFGERLIYNNDKVHHLDRSDPGSDSLKKTLFDNYVLSRHTKKMFISELSNFGRIAALAAPHDEVYNLFGIKLKKIKLLSNQEMLEFPISNLKF